MPWLHLKDLASLGRTCRALAATAASLNLLRANDIARGLERFPVPVFNIVDHVLYPLFSYSPFSILRSSPPLLPWGSLSRPPHKTPSNARPPSPSADICPCVASNSGQILESNSATNHSQLCMEADSPPISKRQREMPPLCGHLLEGELAYDGDSRLHCLSMSSKSDEWVPSNEFLSIIECGPACGCSLRCKYRVTQHGLSVKVAVLKDHLKGWSLRAMDFIPKGAFVFQYAGELLTTMEAQSRQRLYDELRKTQAEFAPSLMVVREHLPSGNLCLRLIIDATHVGNVARFVNHSCDGGNLQPCIARLSGSPIPKLVFFARCDIGEGDELTFSYGDVHGCETHPCFCKTAACKGFLPFEET
ncbi:hypothetical protein GOP47_0015437 [Adiantum capillus-veneris]|uniref:Histone-lysine N-methyltransferase SUVR3 n=1 Tax=Adiantum capillus-veneris TaxID=13818 RepID=A0A9D4UKL9_ADICA|nr:hypothetical protein GOP47_0015437 [Adiantum capillus-veneris]